jgi:hypothetical protein
MVTTTAPARDYLTWTSDAEDLLSALGMYGVDAATVDTIRVAAERIAREEYARGPRTRGERLSDQSRMLGDWSLSPADLAKIAPQGYLDEPIPLPRPYVEGWHLLAAAAPHHVDRRALDLIALRSNDAFIDRRTAEIDAENAAFARWQADCRDRLITARAEGTAAYAEAYAWVRDQVDTKFGPLTEKDTPARIFDIIDLPTGDRPLRAP